MAIDNRISSASSHSSPSDNRVITISISEAAQWAAERRQQAIDHFLTTNNADPGKQTLVVTTTENAGAVFPVWIERFALVPDEDVDGLIQKKILGPAGAAEVLDVTKLNKLYPHFVLNTIQIVGG